MDCEIYKDIIVGDYGTYAPKELTDDLKASDLDMSYAYIKGDIYYLYRGFYLGPKKSTLPGIYKTPNDEIKIIHPNADQRSEYLVSTHWAKPTTENMVSSITENEDAFTVYADAKALNLPEIDPNSDALKRAILEALYVKGIDVDSCKDRFPDRNAVFNFKGALKNKDTKMTARLFVRGCDAIGCDFFIILKDKNPAKPIGNPIDSKESMEKLAALRQKAGIHTAALDGENYIMVSSADTCDSIGEI